MDRMNYDPDMGTSYPLSVDRLKEMQEDSQLLAAMVAGVRPEGACIVSGCGSRGASGVVVMGTDDGAGGVRYELMRVVGANGATGDWLELVEEDLRTTNSEGVSVVYRVERRLEWRVNEPEGERVHWPSLPMLRVQKAARDGEQWEACLGGTHWYAPSSVGYQLMKVRVEGGRIHLKGKVRYAPFRQDVAGVRITDPAIYREAVADGLVARLGAGEYHTLPEGYRPAGEVMVPVEYNGTPSWGVVNALGELTLAVSERTVGDEIRIDCYIDY